MAKFILKQAPFLRILIPMILGISMSPFDLIPALLLALALLVPAVGIRFCIRNASRAWRLRKLPGLLFFLCWFCLGSAVLQGRQLERACPQPEDYFVQAECSLLSGPQIKPNSVQCAVKILSSEPACWEKKHCMIYLRKDSSAMQLRAGNRIVLHTVLSPFGRRSQALQFNYEQYLLNKGFCAGAFVAADSWELRSKRLSWRARSDALSEGIVGQFRRAGFDEESLALVSALVLGRKDLMQAEQRQYFTSAGVAHILAVSGMHVSILFLALDKLLFFIKPRGGGLWCKQILLMLLLWCYAFLTGLSASVLRAVLMCNVSGLGLCFKRRSNSWNTLAFTAFVLLLVNPYYLRDTSFQLSYLAVASILLLMPQAEYYLGMISGKAVYGSQKNIRDKLVATYRDTFLLSLAAQLGTAPISIYYFNQFPRYFLLGNLLLVPLTALLFYACFAFIVLSPLPWLSRIIAFPTKNLAAFFCFSGHWIEKLPAAVTDDLWPSQWDVLAAYLLLISLFYLFKNKRYIYALNKLITTLQKQISH